jgi:hypothetical protein
MELYLLNTASGLKPCYDEDYDEKKKLKIGTTYKATIVQERNLLFHRKFFALIKVGWDNTKLEMPIDSYRKYCIIKAGYGNVYQTPKGVFVDAQSISFGNMNQEQFEKVYSNVLNIIIKDIGTDKEIIEQQILSFL